MIHLTTFLCLVLLVRGLELSIASLGGNKTSPLLYGLLYEDIYHSGDGGLYGEMIRNRAFQGSSIDEVASTLRTTEFWHPVGNVNLSIDTSTPVLSSALPYHMRVDVDANAEGLIGFYNDGFYGFNVESGKLYSTSLYIRGDFAGLVQCYFENIISNETLSSTSTFVNQSALEGWQHVVFPPFTPTVSPGNPNNTFYFTFDGASLAGNSLHVNLLSVFKQTFNNRPNGLREDLAEVLDDLNAKWVRMPGGNNMEGLYPPYYWKWNETIGSLTDRPGRPGTWGDVNTDGFGLLELMQMTNDMDLVPFLALWAGEYLNGTIISEADLPPYVDSAVEMLEFITGSPSTPYGAERASLGYDSPFPVSYVEVGNEDYLNGGTSSYNSYRFQSFYDAVRAMYPSTNVISTIDPPPDGIQTIADLHWYYNQDTFASRYNYFDNADRSQPVIIGEYAAIYPGSTGSNQIGAQTWGTSCAEAITLLGFERNSDVVIGSAYGALIKSYDEAPDTVAVMKHTANEVLKTTSYYIQKLFAEYMGTETLPVTATNGSAGPVYWSAVKDDNSIILKLVNYYGSSGPANAITINALGSASSSARLIRLTAPNATSVNNLPALGGEATSLTESVITGHEGTFSVSFEQGTEVIVLVV